jgi:hypothetical protein
MTTYSNVTTEVEARNLKEGDRLDLEGDKYAYHHEAVDESTKARLEDMYVVVHSVVRETPECVCVYLVDHNPVGFPYDHNIKVKQ